MLEQVDGVGNMQQQYHCPKCRAPVAFGMRFCSNCGVQLNWPTQQQVQQPSQSEQTCMDVQV